MRSGVPADMCEPDWSSNPTRDLITRLRGLAKTVAEVPVRDAHDAPALRPEDSLGLGTYASGHAALIGASRTCRPMEDP